MFVDIYKQDGAAPAKSDIQIGRTGEYSGSATAISRLIVVVVVSNDWINPMQSDTLIRILQHHNGSTVTFHGVFK